MTLFRRTRSKLSVPNNITFPKGNGEFNHIDDELSERSRAEANRVWGRFRGYKRNKGKQAKSMQSTRDIKKVGRNVDVNFVELDGGDTSFEVSFLSDNTLTEPGVNETALGDTTYLSEGNMTQAPIKAVKLNRSTGSFSSFFRLRNKKQTSHFDKLESSLFQSNFFDDPFTAEEQPARTHDTNLHSSLNTHALKKSTTWAPNTSSLFDEIRNDVECGNHFPVLDDKEAVYLSNNTTRSQIERQEKEVDAFVNVDEKIYKIMETNTTNVVVKKQRQNSSSKREQIYSSQVASVQGNMSSKHEGDNEDYLGTSDLNPLSNSTNEFNGLESQKIQDSVAPSIKSTLPEFERFDSTTLSEVDIIPPPPPPLIKRDDELSPHPSFSPKGLETPPIIPTPITPNQEPDELITHVFFCSEYLGAVNKYWNTDKNVNAPQVTPTDESSSPPPFYPSFLGSIKDGLQCATNLSRFEGMLFGDDLCRCECANGEGQTHPLEGQKKELEKTDHFNFNTFLESAGKHGVPMTYYNALDSSDDDWEAHAVKMYVIPGRRDDEVKVSPKLMWVAAKAGEKIAPIYQHLDFSAIVAVIRPDDEPTYGTSNVDMELERVCFSIIGNSGDVYLFEAENEDQRNAMVQGIDIILSGMPVD